MFSLTNVSFFAILYCKFQRILDTVKYWGDEKMEPIVHPFPPLFDKQSQILILGSFPSVKSREGLFFYHHPQNRFWKVLAIVTESEVPGTIEEKRKFLLSHHIALWDVIASCTITGSSDSSIKNVVPNNLMPILSGAKIRQIFCNGGTSYQYYKKYQEPITKIPAIQLPSTSPANAAWSFDRLGKEWSVINEYLSPTRSH